MHVMSAFEYSFLARELAPLVGKHFNRVRKLGDGLYRMKIGSSEVLCELGVRLHLTKYLEEAQEGDKFTDKVEKELGNARLLEIRQINSDRILAFDFSTGASAQASLIFEMFGKGNALLVRDGVTVAAVKYESWADREIKAGSPYRPPKTAPSAKLEATEKYIIVSLMKLPLGKEYALEALSRAGIGEKTPGTSLSGNQLLKLENEMAAMRDGAKPVAFMKNGKLSDFSLTSLSKYKALETREFASLSDAADEYYAHAEKPNPKLEKLLDRLDKQKERLAALKDEEKSFKEKGDFIYANYQEAEALIAAAKAGDEDTLKKRNAKLDKKEKSVEADF